MAIIPEETPNAFATGRNPENAVVGGDDDQGALISPGGGQGGQELAYQGVDTLHLQGVEAAKLGGLGLGVDVAGVGEQRPVIHGGAGGLIGRVGLKEMNPGEPRPLAPGGDPAPGEVDGALTVTL